MLFARRYKEGGPAAVANFEAGVQGFTTRAFRGCGVVTSEPFEVSDEMEAVQMLQRFTQVGEFYVMSKPEGVAANTKGFMDILVYDEESDRHVRISYLDALEATGCFTINDRAAGTVAASVGAPADATVMYGKDGGAITFGTYKALAIALAAANATGTDSEKVADAPVVIARPFIEHAMLSAVLTVSGGDTGATIFGPSDMQISVRLNPNPAQDPCPYSLASLPVSVCVLSFCRPTPLSRRSKGASERASIALFPFLCIGFPEWRIPLTYPRARVLAATTRATSSR